MKPWPDVENPVRLLVRNTFRALYLANSFATDLRGLCRMYSLQRRRQSDDAVRHRPAQPCCVLNAVVKGQLRWICNSSFWSPWTTQSANNGFIFSDDTPNCWKQLPIRLRVATSGQLITGSARAWEMREQRLISMQLRCRPVFLPVANEVVRGK
jgi:hypothetical protein